jgi:integrase
MMGATPRAPTGPLERRGSKGSFKWLCEQYYVSAEYQRLSSRTKYVRRGILDRICEKNGSKPYALMEPRHVRRMRDEMADRPEAANGFVKALRQVYAFAVEYELAQRNPARDVPYLKAKGDGFHSWTMEEVRQFEDHHPIGSKPRLALALMLYTGQRRSDIVRLGPQHIKEGWITLTQAKNRDRKPVTLSIPVLPELKAVLDATPTGNLAFLVTAFGKPFTSNGFGNWFRKQCDEAGLEALLRPRAAQGGRGAGGRERRDRAAVDGDLRLDDHEGSVALHPRRAPEGAGGVRDEAVVAGRGRAGKRGSAGWRTVIRRIPAPRLKLTKKNLEAGMSKTEKLKLDEGESSTLPPEAFAEFQRATDAPGTRIRGLARAAKKAQGLLKDAD